MSHKRGRQGQADQPAQAGGIFCPDPPGHERGELVQHPSLQQRHRQEQQRKTALAKSASPQ
jgi:hypothetical protein